MNIHEANIVNFDGFCTEPSTEVWTTLFPTTQWEAQQHRGPVQSVHCWHNCSHMLFLPIPIFSSNSSLFSEINTYVFRKRFLLCHLNIFSDFRFSSRCSQNAHLKIIENNSESSFLNHLRFIQKSSEFWNKLLYTRLVIFMTQLLNI